jgi:uncharacterized phiE125 gp8 family phage protein
LFTGAFTPWRPTALLPVRTAEPSEPIITVDAVKEHLRLESVDASDEYLGALIGAAETYLDGYTGVLGRALVTQSWARSFDCFPCDDIVRLPLGPLQSVESITYYDLSGSQLTLETSKYSSVEDALGPCIRLGYNQIWPNTQVRPDAVTIDWTCGYGAAADLPAPIIHAGKLLVGHFYANREAVALGDRVAAIALPMAVDMLLEPFRGPWLA